jgi:hypothetical protein
VDLDRELLALPSGLRASQTAIDEVARLPAQQLDPLDPHRM